MDTGIIRCSLQQLCSTTYLRPVRPVKKKEKSNNNARQQNFRNPPSLAGTYLISNKTLVPCGRSCTQLVSCITGCETAAGQDETLPQRGCGATYCFGELSRYIGELIRWLVVLVQ